MSGVRGLGWRCLVCALVGLAGLPVVGLAAGSSWHGRDLPGHEASLWRGVAGRGGPSMRVAVGSVHRARSREVHRGASRRFRSAHKAPRVSRRRFAAVPGSVSLRASPLVIVGSPGEAEQLKAEQEAKLTNPEAIAVREESRTKFSGLDNEQASKVDGEAFSAVIDEPDGGPPRLPEGQSITGYLNANVGQVDLGGGEHGLVQTLAPMAIQTPSGDWSPVDLGLSEVGGAFLSANPLVGVRMTESGWVKGCRPRRLASPFLRLASDGLSLAGSEGVVDGATVFFANTSTDTDTVVKPSTWGFAVDTILRSVESPQRLWFRVGMPEGASLVGAKDGSGAVEVVKEGATIGVISAPAARDAAGVVVPVSVGVAGSTLTLNVTSRSGEFLYPIEVDPEFYTGTESSILPNSNWKFAESGGGFSHGESPYKHEIWIDHNTAYSSGQRGEFYYKTNGDSRLYEIKTSAAVGPTTTGPHWWAEARGYLEFEGPGGYENSKTIAQYGELLESENEIKSQLCVAECSSATGTEHNLVRFVELPTGPLNANSIYLGMNSATISISQPKETHGTVSYSSLPELEYTGAHGEKVKTPNVAYGTAHWLSPSTGALEFKSHDNGLGVSETTYEAEREGGGWNSSPSFAKNYLANSAACTGVQCAAEQHEVLTYSSFDGVLAEGGTQDSGRSA